MIETPVLIIGGGPVGLTLALLLSRKGQQSVLVHRRSGIVLDIPQDLAPLPLERIGETPGVTLRLAWSLFGFERFADHVIAHIIEAGGERQQQIRAQFLIGCDGAASRVRNFLDIDLEPAPRTEGKIARAFGRGRVLLAGDAAHTLGAGSSVGLEMGLMDARRLADLLAEALGAGDGRDILPAYEHDRRDCLLSTV